MQSGRIVLFFFCLIQLDSTSWSKPSCKIFGNETEWVWDKVFGHVWTLWSSPFRWKNQHPSVRIWPPCPCCLLWRWHWLLQRRSGWLDDSRWLNVWSRLMLQWFLIIANHNLFAKFEALMPVGLTQRNLISPLCLPVVARFKAGATPPLGSVMHQMQDLHGRDGMDHGNWVKILLEPRSLLLLQGRLRLKQHRPGTSSNIPVTLQDIWRFMTLSPDWPVLQQRVLWCFGSFFLDANVLHPEPPGESRYGFRHGIRRSKLVRNPSPCIPVAVLRVVSAVGQLILLREKRWKSQCKWGIPGVSWVSCDWMWLTGAAFWGSIGWGTATSTRARCPDTMALVWEESVIYPTPMPRSCHGDTRHSDAFDKNHENKHGGRLRLSRVDRIGNWNHSYNCIVVYLDSFRKEVLHMFFLVDSYTKQIPSHVSLRIHCQLKGIHFQHAFDEAIAESRWPFGSCFPVGGSCRMSKVRLLG